MNLGTQTGSVINHLHSRAVIGQPEPKPGMGATILLWTDRHAATIRNVLRIGNKLAVQVTRDLATVVKGSAHDGSAEYEFTTTPDGTLQTFAFNGDKWEQYHVNPETKRWNKAKSGRGLRIGERDEYRDPSF